MAGPSHRRQSSWEDVFDFSAAQPLFANAQERTQAVGRFRRIVNYFEAAEQPAPRYSGRGGYNRPALIRLTFEYARSQESQGAATNKTPQPSPVYHAAVQQAQTQEEQQRVQDFVGTPPERLGASRAECLTRDRYRCVITRTFDLTEAIQRSRQPPARDDGGN
ncbi:hypothetical protein B0T24DRAFT_366219 [Lasiosphaeria ovina]|uniref:Uncharacterized protein n=1 Tax=Lasiosphaeria ovina TaxID=92902 RepID=A0AAE0JYB3_9PEZI|nr:hypothetical protein B0T24DRAFT_366219 [Lasiosphaeria ovina]